MEFDFDVIQLPAENKIKDTVYRICLNGDLIFNSHQELSSALSDIIQKGGRKIIIDFKDLVIIDTVGIGLLIKYKKELDKENGELVISGCPDHILNIFIPLNIEKLIKVFDNIEDAENYFSHTH